MTVDPLTSWLQVELARMLDVPAERIQNDTPLMALGLDSLIAVRLCGALSEKVGFEVDPMTVFDGDTIAQIAANVRAVRTT
ncbi:acyl carrier protein [Caenimonas sp. SL110]|uniref:acyl carrier protein n=1 Tax=Caenimonas sp. SL110 TaxID=1450524 RepID=UPI0006529812|nr:acyl carrier protein [Caenimonas sp. SL110]